MREASYAASEGRAGPGSRAHATGGRAEGVGGRAERATLEPPRRGCGAPPIETGFAGLDRVERVIGDARGGGRGGPTLIVVGGLHGNEPAGVHALRRVFAELARGEVELHGRVVGLSGNRKALTQGQRYLVDDLNRSWWPERVERLRGADGALDAEDEEIHELDRELSAVLAEARGDVYFFDLHSTSGDGGTFSTFDDNLPNRHFAMRLPVPQVIGLEEELSGTLVGYLTDRGLVAIGFEAGQHEDPASVDRAEAAIWIALESAGLLPQGAERVERARDLLRRVGRDLPRVVEVRYRHAVTHSDGFVMRPGYRNFQPIRAGEELAEDARGAVVAPLRGLMLMPLYQGQGEDGFFLIRPVSVFWLQLSAALRRLRFERFVHWLPGVARDPEDPDGFVVDRRRARWLALQIFHLLGFKRRGKAERFLRMFKRGPRA